MSSNEKNMRFFLKHFHPAYVTFNKCQTPEIEINTISQRLILSYQIVGEQNQFQEECIFEN